MSLLPNHPITHQTQEGIAYVSSCDANDNNSENDGSDVDAAQRVSTIASFMNLSDVASMASDEEWTDQHQHQLSYSDDNNEEEGYAWESEPFEGLDPPPSGFPATAPLTPGLVAVSPNPSSLFGEGNENGDLNGCYDSSSNSDEEEETNQESLQSRGRKWAQAKLAAAVFSHPEPLRSFCLDAYITAKECQQQREQQLLLQEQSQVDEEEKVCPENLVEPCNESNHQRNRKRRRQRNDDHDSRRRQQQHVVHAFVDNLLLPVAVAVDVLGGVWELYLDTSFAIVRVSTMTAQGCVDVAVHVVVFTWDTTITCITSPIALLQMLSRPFHTTTEVVVSGIQSVTTNVGSASSTFLRFTSSSQLSSKASHGPLAGGVSRGGTQSSRSGSNGVTQQQQLRELSKSLNHKLLRRLSSLNSAASVISYRELADDTGGLSKHAKNRVQRMMHYDVSLRPFVATVKLPPTVEAPVSSSSVPKQSSPKFVASDTAETLPASNKKKPVEDLEHRPDSAEVLYTSLCTSPSSSSSASSETSSSESSSSIDPEDESPFMCTPQSFPPTPASRRMVLARGTKFADDVVFLARDQLRVHDGLASSNVRTREMAQALTQGKRLAVFDADDASVGIELTCGQHVATKVMGSMLYYCSTRSMVPVLRNCCVYFEMTILPPPAAAVPAGAANSIAMLSIGLSTKEMPPNTLVGAWKGSVGLCSTGQLLTAGQWCSPVDPTKSAYGTPSSATTAAGEPSTTTTTVGCLVCLDDASAFETWDGVMVTAAVTFTVNEQPIVSPTNAPAIILPNNNHAGGVGVEVGTGVSSSNMGPWLPHPPSSQTTQVPMGQQRQQPPHHQQQHLQQQQHQQQQQQPQMHGNPTTIPNHNTSAPQTSSTSPRCCFTLPLLVPAEEELYPTATLHSPATAVMCRFSAGDVLATSREPLGVPEGVTIYAVDGSVIFD